MTENTYQTTAKSDPTNDETRKAHTKTSYKNENFHQFTRLVFVWSTGAVPANQPVSGGEATDRRKSFRRKMADCPS